MADDQIPPIYQTAIRRFEEITKKKLDDPDLLKMRTVNDLLQQVESRNQKFIEFREKKHAFFRALSAAMKPIELVGNLAAGAASMAFPPSSLCFSAAQYLIGAAKGVSKSYDAIQDLMGTLKDFTIRLEIYSREHISKELSDKLSDVFVVMIEIFAYSREAVKSGILGRFAKFGTNVLRGSDDKIQVAIANLAKLTKAEDSLVSAETLTASKKTGRTVEKTASIVEDMAVTVISTNIMTQEAGMAVGQMTLEVTELKEQVGILASTFNESKANAMEKEIRKEQEKVKNVLQPSVTAQDWYDKINNSRVPGTGDWIRSENMFKSWLEKSVPVLWVSGNPGSGKSYLSSNIISFLREQHPQRIAHPSYVSIGHFFFKDDNPLTRSFHQALRDLAYQISQNDPVYRKYITTAVDSPADISTLHSVWRTLFTAYFIDNPNVNGSIFMVFDGVDEAFHTERQTFLELIKDLTEHEGPSRIQLALVGRPQLTDNIFDALETGVVQTIHVTALKNSADITHYIQISIQKSNFLRKLEPALREEIVEKLSSGAQGMFIWVDLIFKELVHKRTPLSIRKALDEAPKGLFEMIRHVLEGLSASLSDEDVTFLNELLAWTACAKRPLKLGELDTALKLLSPKGEGMLLLEDALRKRFAAFFSLTREDGLTTADLQKIASAQSNPNDEQEVVIAEGYDDVDNETDFDSNISTTEVTFCHASIGDFLRDPKEGKVRTGEGPAIGVDINEAKVGVLKICLRLFCDEDLRLLIKDSYSLHSYAYKNWQEHLRDIEPSKINFEDKIIIGGYLAKMFGQTEHMDAWSGDIPWTFFNDENVKLYRKWFDDKDVCESLPSNLQEWVGETAEMPANTFMPLAMYIARKWLQEIQWIPKNACWIVWAFINLQKGTPLGPNPDEITKADHIVEIAEWAHFEKDSTWYRRVAMAMRDLSLYDDAYGYFEKALEVDPKNRLARAGMSLTHQYREEYQKAINLDKINEEILETLLIEEPDKDDVHRAELHMCQERMARCYFELKNEINAAEYVWKAMQNKKDCDFCISVNLYYKMRKEDWSGIFGMLRKMKEEKMPGKKYSLLSESLWENQYEYSEYFEILVKAGKAANEFPFLINVYRDAVSDARKALKPVIASLLEICLAQLYYTWAREPEKALSIWGGILSRFSSSKVEADMGYVKRMSLLNLAYHYFNCALDAVDGSVEVDKNIKKLERLAKSKAKPTDELSTVINCNPASFTLGIWYRRIGEQEKADACFRVHMKEILQILSDNDPSNDSEGFMRLYQLLAAIGNDKEVIAFTHSLKYEEALEESAQLDDRGSSPSDGDVVATPAKSDTEDVRTADAENVGEVDAGEKESTDGVDEVEEDHGARCDGCWKEIPFHSLYVCRYCLNIGFCEDCLSRLKGGTLDKKVCHPCHDWLYIPPADYEIVPGKLFIDGKMIPIRDWINGLKVKWKV